MTLQGHRTSEWSTIPDIISYQNTPRENINKFDKKQTDNFYFPTPSSLDLDIDKFRNNEFLPSITENSIIGTSPRTTELFKYTDTNHKDTTLAASYSSTTQNLLFYDIDSYSTDPPKLFDELAFDYNLVHDEASF